MLENITIRKQELADAKEVYNLVRDTNILDVNSEYLYLLQSTYFRNTCVVAVENKNIIGFVSGFIDPNDSKTLFVWQVGVDEKYRGFGLAKKMIMEILSNNIQKNIEYIQTTISPSNKSSESLFLKLCKELKANIVLEKLFDKSDFNNSHEDEILYKIGPFNVGEQK